MEEKTLYRTTIAVEVLSKEPFENISIEDLAYQITEGDCSGTFDIVKVEALTTEGEIEEACLEQGTDVEFFFHDEE